MILRVIELVVVYVGILLFPFFFSRSIKCPTRKLYMMVQ